MSELQTMFENITDNMRSFMDNMKGSGHRSKSKRSGKYTGKGTSRHSSSSKNVTQRIFNTYSSQKNLVPNKKYNFPTHMIKIPSTSIPKYDLVPELSRSRTPRKHISRVYLPKIKENIPHFTANKHKKTNKKYQPKIYSAPQLRLPKLYKEKYYKRYLNHHRSV
jgi:hypothetical protein